MSLTPDGVQDFLPADTAQLNVLIDRLRSVFDTAGFGQIRTPTIEYFDTLKPGLGPNLVNQAITFQDANRKLLTLRPDHTTPIARLASSRLRNEPLPLKLCYIDPVYRIQPRRDEIECLQAGVELLGQPGPEGDAVVIGLCIAALRALGFEQLCVEIGDVSFVDGLASDEKEALLTNNYAQLGHIPARGKQDVIRGNTQLETLYSLLEAQGVSQFVSFNKGIVKHLDYYSGMLFDICVPGVRQVVASGGRYDGLVSQFGWDVPSVGFAMDLNVISRAVARGGVSSALPEVSA